MNLLCEIASTRLYHSYTKSKLTWTWYGEGMEEVWSGYYVSLKYVKKEINSHNTAHHELHLSIYQTNQKHRILQARFSSEWHSALTHSLLLFEEDFVSLQPH